MHQSGFNHLVGDECYTQALGLAIAMAASHGCHGCHGEAPRQSSKLLKQILR
jgi:hypothetical protein